MILSNGLKIKQGTACSQKIIPLPCKREKLKTNISMKQLMLIAAIVGFAFAANAQTKDSKKDEKKSEQAQMKEHKCSDACRDGKHFYAHGEKGHTCGEDCKKMMMNKEAGMKDHKCTDACKDGQHLYAHGEKGHTCSPQCQKMMDKKM